MNDDTTFTGFDGRDVTDNSLSITYTQVASCVMGTNRVERRRQSLRAKLEREHFERQQQLENSFITTFRNLFSSTKQNPNHDKNEIHHDPTDAVIDAVYNSDVALRYLEHCHPGLWSRYRNIDASMVIIIASIFPLYPDTVKPGRLAYLSRQTDLKIWISD